MNPDHWGGVHTHTESLARLLLMLKNEVSILTLSSVERGESSAGIRYIPVTIDQGVVTEQSFQTCVTPAFLKLHHDHPVDLIISEGYYAFDLLSNTHLHNIPIIAFVHNFAFIHISNGWREIDSVRSCFAYFGASIFRIMGRMVRFEIPFYRRVRAVVSVSQFNADLLKHIYGIPPDKLFCLPNWIDTDLFKPDPVLRQKGRQTLGLKDTDIAFLQLGNMWRPKGFHLTVEAFKSVQKRMPRAVMLLSGNMSDERYVTSLRNTAKTAGDRIRFLKPSNRSNLTSLLNAADVFLLPSIMSEGLSYALLEAMSTGLPVIASRRGGNLEQVSSAGLLVHPGNVADLADAICYLGEKETERVRLGQAARERILQFYSTPKAADQWKHILEKVRIG
ncbi:MAG: glycosyltransferase family 4 protein [Elusimicrobia bacterium]|nr:glycosyltransferase family 4 protein [Candidatus Obscuribacterium magneticum]